ncbi:hypothetical protein [Mycobacterium sp.]|uniref:hypothetical protein n=1 Tax=Mycobacterium sp. TaxID=1785 RepID=UPI003F9B2147
MIETPTGSLLEGLAATLAADDAFAALEEPDARRVAAQVALDFIMYSPLGAAGRGATSVAKVSPGT